MSETSVAKPAIARIWRGRTTRERADAYEAYNYEVGIKPLIEKAAGVQTFREDREGETQRTPSASPKPERASSLAWDG